MSTPSSQPVDGQMSKRKAPLSFIEREVKRRVHSEDCSESTVASKANSLASFILQELKTPVHNDSIGECSKSALAILRDRPDDVLALAHQKLHTWPYQDVPLCWTRLYEEASLYKAVQMLNDISTSGSKDLHWLDELVSTLDTGLTLSGGTARARLFEAIFEQIDSVLLTEELLPDVECENFDINPPFAFETTHAIPRSNGALSFMAFQQHLDNHTTPLVISDAISSWPALERWQHPSYLLKHTLGGRRLVPVEIGSSYVDSDWSQKMIPFRDFLASFPMSGQVSNNSIHSSKDNGNADTHYLAQHDLFNQIPALKNDIRVPDYCYTSPPAKTTQRASRSSGLCNDEKMDENKESNHDTELDEDTEPQDPLLNAWLGPAGTKTPLHTDPYYNILAQVVGYKYVRLYPPHETPKLYPRGVDEKGISMENTSGVDVGVVRPVIRSSASESDGDTNAEAGHSGFNGDRGLGEALNDHDAARQELHEKFPLFADAEYLEAVLAPGECLFIPLGWWHYVESLSTSFSVSFWWK